MKKCSIFLGLSAILSISLLGNFSNAEYNLQIDANNNEVYLMSGDTQITLENADKYLSSTGTDSNTDTGASLDITENSTNELITTGTGSEINTGNIASTGNTVSTGNTIGTGNTVTTGTEINSGTVISSGTIVSTGSETNTGVNTSTGTNSETKVTRILGENVNAEILTGDEFDRSLYRMYMNGLTKYDNSEEFRPYDNLTREESTKMIGQLYSVLGFPKEDKGFNCSFVDTNMFDPTLAEHIYNVCRRGIFRGNDKTQQFMPHDNLTKGQLLAVLLRIFEGKMSDESGQPRWIEYYIKALTLGLSNETNLAKFDKPVSRREASLLISRFKNMVIDETDYELYLARLEALMLDNDSYLNKLEELKTKRTETLPVVNTGENLEEPTIDTSNPDSNGITAATGSITTGSTISLDIIAGNETLTDSPEFMEAINWMYDMGMTSYNTTESFMPYNTITRAQVAKMLDRFAISTNMTEIRNFGNCEFSDVESGSEYRDAITRVCQYGIMAGSNDKFFPDQIVTKAEFVAMLIRLFDGNTLDETLNPRWTSYYKRAIEIGLISAQDTVTFTSEIARYDVATYLYRLKVRLTMYNNLNSSQLSDEIFKTLDETQDTNEEGKASAKVYVDILALNNSAFTDGYIELLGERYRIKKANTDSFNVGANSFVRYGTLYSIETGDPIGSVSFILTNGALVEGTVRINENSYYLTKDSNTTTYYNLIQR